MKPKLTDEQIKAANDFGDACRNAYAAGRSHGAIGEKEKLPTKLLGVALLPAGDRIEWEALRYAYNAGYDRGQWVDRPKLGELQ